MKRRMNIMLVAIVVMLAAMILMVPGRETAIETALASDVTPDTPALHTPAPQFPSPDSTLPAAVLDQHPPLALATVLASPVEAAAPEVPTSPLPPPPADVSTAIKPDADKPGEYTAIDGDTLSNVAGGLLGSDTKKNRDAVVAANPSLQVDRDYVLAGKTYVLNASPAEPVAASSQVQAEVRPTARPAEVAKLVEVPEVAQVEADRVLRYTAQPGDSVSVLAGSLLGENSKANRDTIISHNQSLRDHPDLVVAGKTYKIPTTDGLSAAAEPSTAQPSVPSVQPDADEAVQIGSGRDLRYTALAGDTVSKLAELLLGSDTPANRSAIINHNPSLKADPDRVVSGQTYWIPAPSASVAGSAIGENVGP